ncbi:transposase zinc-binding domain-containing protein [Myxococcota bacterium]|nr:transposase zinc-binding domain-containing protein [Myxococcota bacterium]
MACKQPKAQFRYKQEFAAYIRCGILAHGFVRLKCTECEKSFAIPFSCKGRGFCPSCMGRRMNEMALHLTEDVFPKVPVRLQSPEQGYSCWRHPRIMSKYPRTEKEMEPMERHKVEKRNGGPYLAKPETAHWNSYHCNLL